MRTTKLPLLYVFNIKQYLERYYDRDDRLLPLRRVIKYKHIMSHSEKFVKYTINANLII